MLAGQLAGSWWLGCQSAVDRRIQPHALWRQHLHQPFTDHAEAPGDDRGQGNDNEQRYRHDECAGGQPRYSGCEQLLQWPDDGDNQQGEGDRSKHRAGEVERGRYQDAGAQRQQGVRWAERASSAARPSAASSTARGDQQARWRQPEHGKPYGATPVILPSRSMRR